MNKEKILEVIGQELEMLYRIDLKTADPNASCQALGLDSLDVIELGLEVEKKLGVVIKDNLLKLTTSMTIDQVAAGILASVVEEPSSAHGSGPGSCS